jgi:hypothetical protein
MTHEQHAQIFRNFKKFCEASKLSSAMLIFRFKDENVIGMSKEQTKRCGLIENIFDAVEQTLTEKAIKKYAFHFDINLN